MLSRDLAMGPVIPKTRLAKFSTVSILDEANRNAMKNQDQAPFAKKIMNNFKKQFSAHMFSLPAFYWLNFDLLLFWASNLVGLMFLPTEMAANGYAGQQVGIYFRLVEKYWVHFLIGRNKFDATF